MIFNLGSFEKAVKVRLDRWRADRFLPRLWEKDPTLWAAGPVPEIANRLGWLDLPRVMAGRLASIMAFAEEIEAEGFRHVVLLGMGGSSLGPDVLALTWMGMTVAAAWFGPGPLQGLFVREYRDHRLEWMLRSGGRQVVLDGMDKRNIRFAIELG